MPNHEVFFIKNMQTAQRGVRSNQFMTTSMDGAEVVEVDSCLMATCLGYQ